MADDSREVALARARELFKVALGRGDEARAARIKLSMLTREYGISIHEVQASDTAGAAGAAGERAERRERQESKPAPVPSTDDERVPFGNLKAPVSSAERESAEKQSARSHAGRETASSAEANDERVPFRDLPKATDAPELKALERWLDKTEAPARSEDEDAAERDEERRLEAARASVIDLEEERAARVGSRVIHKESAPSDDFGDDDEVAAGVLASRRAVGLASLTGAGLLCLAAIVALTVDWKPAGPEVGAPAPVASAQGPASSQAATQQIAARARKTSENGPAQPTPAAETPSIDIAVAPAFRADGSSAERAVEGALAAAGHSPDAFPRVSSAPDLPRLTGEQDAVAMVDPAVSVAEARIEPADARAAGALRTTALCRELAGDMTGYARKQIVVWGRIYQLDQILADLVRLKKDKPVKDPAYYDGIIASFEEKQTVMRRRAAEHLERYVAAANSIRGQDEECFAQGFAHARTTAEGPGDGQAARPHELSRLAVDISARHGAAAGAGTSSQAVWRDDFAALGKDLAPRIE